VADVLPRPRGRIDAPFDGGILGRQAKGIPANRMQNVMASHEVEAGNDVGNGIHAKMTEMQRPRGIREHGQNVDGLLAGPAGVAVPTETGSRPEVLPFGVDFRQAQRRAGRMPRLRGDERTRQA
jgi:hypothetical protein